MRKNITELELGEIINRVIAEDYIADTQTYRNFLMELADVVTAYIGGRVGSFQLTERTATPEEAANLSRPTIFSINISPDDRIPADGGMWADYDKTNNEEWIDEVRRIS